MLHVVLSSSLCFQLRSEILNDDRRFMKQDDFVLHAADGDIKNVKKGLDEKRLCSVKGNHKEKVTRNLVIVIIGSVLALMVYS